MKQAKSLKKNKGVAILITLAVVVLMSVLAIGVLDFGKQGQQFAAIESATTQANILAESAVNIAMAQLREATSQQLTPEIPVPWASQPGAIRTHDLEGRLTNIYKLYSASRLTAETEAELVDDLPREWNSDPEAYVDLNVPAFTSEGELEYPIADPRSDAEGFSYEQTNKALNGTAAPTAPQPSLPMPVRWLYSLADGTLGTLKNGAWQHPSVQPSLINPIVGRIAFWTDDESCKVNTRTASEGIFWDTPRFGTQEDLAFAKHPPESKEFQRHPGHPAMVSLSAVLFPGKRYLPPELEVVKRKENHPDYQNLSLEQARQLWAMHPDFNADAVKSSNGGLNQATQLSEVWKVASLKPLPILPPPANSDELLLARDEIATEIRPLAPLAQDPQVQLRMARSRFLTTTESAAPETTLYGTPRISLWPVNSSSVTYNKPSASGKPLKVSPYDEKMVTVSKLNERDYLVYRNRAGYGYEDFVLKKDYATTNENIFNYLKALTSKPVPGFDRDMVVHSFADKYGREEWEDRDQILMSAMDYIRSANFVDGQLASENQVCVVCAAPDLAYYGFGQVSALTSGNAAVLKNGSASQKASFWKTPRGVGRVPTVSEAALVITRRAETDGEGKVIAGKSNKAAILRKFPNSYEIEVSLVLEMFVPGQGYTDYRPYTSVRFAGLDMSGETPKYLTDGPKFELCGKSPWLDESGREVSPLPSDKRFLRNDSKLAVKRNLGGGYAGVTSFRGNITFNSVIVPKATQNLNLSFLEASASKQWALYLYDEPDMAATDGMATNLLQVVPLRFPDLSGIQLPALPTESEIVAGKLFGFADRTINNFDKGTPLICAGDVVQSMVPEQGDYRLTAASRLASGFVPHASWGKLPQAHSFKDASLPANQNGGHSYFADLSLPQSFLPDFPFATSEHIDGSRKDLGQRGTARPDVTGDFDNGAGLAPDGPYVNRADDGSTSEFLSGAVSANGSKAVPYFNPAVLKYSELPVSVPGSFIPTRMFPGAGVFGSLSTGVRSQVPWQTLLFRPQPPKPTGQSFGHFGGTGVPDHLLMDLFWMPIVTPSLISTPMETAGKINLNHRLVPFSHIHRTTALHALLKGERMTAVPDSMKDTYKSDPTQSGSTVPRSCRLYLDPDETIRIWNEEVLDKQRLFLSASEICEHYLVPEGQRGMKADMEQFWKTHRLTGDNSKERPYTVLQSRLTTRSNVFKVHYIAQAIQKPRSNSPSTFMPGQGDKVTAEKRGSRSLRRQLDFQNKNIPDYTDGKPHPPLDQFYVWQSR